MNKNPHAVAVLAALAASSGSAHAVFLDPSGLGEALIYPYYTVQTAGGNAFNTYLSVANTTTRAKAVKVRFREGKNARPVLDFNLYLSPNDVWTAAMGPADATPSSPAVLVTADKSCTSPPVPAGGFTFRNSTYVGANTDGGPVGLDRTREGYFEIIEMANLVAGSAAANAVAHTVAGAPANCALVQPEGGFTAATNGAVLQRPSGGLTGTYTLINVANGLNFGGNATALSQFSAVPVFSDAGGDIPNLGSANPAVATTSVNNLSGASGPGTTTYTATFANGRDAVSATLMRASLVNEYALDVATVSSTDWVLTFPTKQFYTASNTDVGVQPPTPLFANRFSAIGACEPFHIILFNREERGPTTTECDCGVLPPGPPPPNVCWASSVISIGRVPSASAISSVLGSLNSTAVDTGGFENGLGRLSFVGTTATTSGLSSLPGAGFATNVNTGASVSGATVNFRGIPVIGFMARTLNNGALSCTTFGGAQGLCAGSYGAAFDHKYSVVALPTP